MKKEERKGAGETGGKRRVGMEGREERKGGQEGKRGGRGVFSTAASF